MSPLTIGAGATSAFILAAVGVAGFRRFAVARQLLDIPNLRSSHSRPTPRGAGIVIVLLATVALLAGYLSRDIPIESFGTLIVLCSLAIAGISLLDDLRTLSSLSRLAVHASAAALVAALWVLALSLTGTSAVVVASLATLWVVGVTNAFNFMDGIDGIAGGQAIVSGATILILAHAAGDRMIVVLTMSIVGASAGFLIHNWPPARVFMGDVGSAWLGFVLAAAALHLSTYERRAGLAAAFVLWPFIFDTALTLLRRARRGENLMQSHRSHLYQRLVGAGTSHRWVTTEYVVASALCGASGIAWSWHLAPSALPLTCAAAIPAVFLLQVRSRERAWSDSGDGAAHDSL